jgi:hypothetical protein
MQTYHTTKTSSPSLQQLGKATACALAVAAGILVIAVLPAEYGIDPIGTGKLLGLTQLNRVGDKAAIEPAADAVPGAPVTATTPISRTEAVLRNDEMIVTLQPGEGTEVKAQILKGEHFVFSWSADAPVKSDMHGEPFHAKEKEFTTYWKVPQQSAAQGTFTAPFDGIHGWFWRNKGSKPVTITVRVSGFQQKLYRPS